MVGQSHHLYRLAVAGEHRQSDIVKDRKAVEQVDDLKAARNSRLDTLGDCGERDIAIFQQDLAAVRLRCALIRLTRVVLPAPLEPTNDRNSPLFITKSRPSQARVSPNCFRKLTVFSSIMSRRFV
jgi:hypothetical protein